MNPAAFDKLLWRSRKAAPAHPQTRLVQAGQATLRARDTGGDHPALVFLCDPPNMIEHYDALIAELGADFRIVVVELPGFGFSRLQSARALEFAGAVESIETGLQQLGPGTAVVCGPCICGFVAVELARRNRLPLAGLVLVQTPDLAGMVAWTGRMDPQRRLRRPYLGQALVRMMAARLATFWYGYATGKGYDHAPMTATATEGLRRGAAYPLATMLQRWTTGPRDDAVTLPVLAIWGDQDRSHAPTDKRSTLKHAPHAEMHTFAGCGHFPELEAPARFAEVLRPFLSQCFAGHEDRA